jgi:hypothetical protein
MANPILSASLDKSSYAPGDQMLLTVQYGDPDNASSAIHVKGVDLEGNPASVDVTYTVADTVTLEVDDDGGRVFTKISDSGTVAVYKATA